MALDQEPLILPGTQGLTGVRVNGFKSLVDEQGIEVAPLTILAGANSSGKSSIMQPLLLLKQTLEASFDPDPLKLDGPNVKFTSVEQMLPTRLAARTAPEFVVELQLDHEDRLRLQFSHHPEKRLELSGMRYAGRGDVSEFRPEMDQDAIRSLLPEHVRQFFDELVSEQQGKRQLELRRNRCFLEVGLRSSERNGELMGFAIASPAGAFEPYIRGLIHLPGLRGNPERIYPSAGAGPTFPGPFQSYTAGVIDAWKRHKERKRLKQLGAALEQLGLTWKVLPKSISDAQVELRVGRLPHAQRGGALDLVSIADVGFGVSQVLPLLVALIAAKPRQPVYVEQPEIHLHPRAQHQLARVLVDAANRGVLVIAETHSALLLLGIQSLIAEGAIAPDKVRLNWFSRREDGSTEIATAMPDEAGAFGDWPVDFGEVTLKAQAEYLDYAQSRLF